MRKLAGMQLSRICFLVYVCMCTCIVKVKQQQKTSADDGILPSPFVIDEGDNGRVSQQNALFFAQKVQQVPGRHFITSLNVSKYSVTAPSINVSQQNALFFAQKVQHVPAILYYIT